MEQTVEGRFPNLNQTKSKQVLSFYHDCVLRVFDNHASRKSEYLGTVLLSTAKSGDLPKLCKSLEKVDLNKVDFNLKERNTENTPLMVAAEHGHDKIISILLSCGSDVTLRNAAGQTALEIAPERITEFILDAVNRPGAGIPLLCQAAWQGNATVVKKLLHLNPGLNVNSKNSEGFTPLLLVTRDLDFFDKIKLDVFNENYNPTEVVALLLHQNADCTVVNNEGQSALHLTARNHGTNARNIISLLARKDSLNVDLRDIQDYSPLHCASEIGDPNILLTFIGNGADVNARGPVGRTPLHLTASRGDGKTSEILIKHGANVLLVDDLGFTPIDVAKGNNVQLLLKEAWAEHAQRSVDSLRIKSAPVILPLERLDRVDESNVINDDDDIEEPVKETAKKSGKTLPRRSHSEDQTKHLLSSAMPSRTRSYSSGPAPRSKLDPIVPDISQSQSGRAISPSLQKTHSGRTNCPEIENRMNKIPQTDVVSRPIAKVSVLNINLKGPHFRLPKSKSCSELPFIKCRVQKFSNVRTSSESQTQLLDNPLSLRGRSVSAIPFSSFETLPGIMLNSADAVNCEEEDEPSVPDPTPEPQILFTPPADGNFDPNPDEDSPTTSDTDILNKTFNSKEKPVFWFPVVQYDTSSSQKKPTSDRGFFVDFKTLPTPSKECIKCGENFKPEDPNSGSSQCPVCRKASVEKNGFWVPFGNDDRRNRTGTRSCSVDDRTVCIERKTLNVLRKKKLSECSSTSDGTELPESKTMSYTTGLPRSFGRIKRASVNREQAESSTTDDTELWVNDCREHDDGSTNDVGERFGRMKASSLKRQQAESWTTGEIPLQESFEKVNTSRRHNDGPTTDARKTSDRAEPMSATSSQENLMNEQDEEQDANPGIRQDDSEQQHNDGELDEEVNEFHISLVTGQGHEQQKVTAQNSSNQDSQCQTHDNEKTNNFPAKETHDKLSLTARGDSKESENFTHDEMPEEKFDQQREDTIQGKDVSSSKTNFCAEFEATEREKQRPNINNSTNPAHSSKVLISTKSEDCRQSLQSTYTDVVCSKTSDISTDVVGQLDNELMPEERYSPAADRKSIEKSLDEGISCFEKQQQPSLSEKIETAIKAAKDVGSDGMLLDNIDKLGTHNEQVNTCHSNPQLPNGSPEEMPGNQTGGSVGYSGGPMDKPDHLGMPNEFVNTDVTPHQVIIVNPFPTPEPPRVPVVNVTSNCQCDRFASFSKISGTVVKKKGRGKKPGARSQKTGASGQNTGASGNNTQQKSKKAVGRKENEKENEKDTKRIPSGGKKGKKKFKNNQEEAVKEVSVVQTNLKANTSEENESTVHSVVKDSTGTGNKPTLVRLSTFVKEKFSMLSPIPEASRSGSSVQDSASDVLATDTEHFNNITSTKESDIRFIRSSINKETLAADDNAGDSRLSTSEPVGTLSEMNDNLDDLIQEILDETEELKMNHAKGRHSNIENADAHAELITNVEDTVLNGSPIAGKAEMLASSKHSTEIDYHSKETFVSTWLLGQHLDDSDYNRHSSEHLRETSEASRNLSGQKSDYSHSIHNSSAKHRDLSEFLRTTSSDTNATDSTYGSSGSTPLADISSDYSTVSDDTLRSTSGRVDVLNVSKLGTRSETISEKPTVSESHSEQWTTSSVTISLPANSTVSGFSSRATDNRQTDGGYRETVGDSRRVIVDGISLDGERNSEGMVHSRLSRRLVSEASGTCSEMTSSEEEEIVWRKGNMLGKGAFGKVWCGLTNTGQMIAVKQVELITSNIKQAERQYEKLQEEVALLKSLRHKNVVSYLGTCLDGGVVNIFMEFVPGGSIASILARFGPLEERVFRYYTKQILVGVEYLHRNNVVHRIENNMGTLRKRYSVNGA